MYEAEVIADSISTSGVRVTSIGVQYPHAVHKDMLRHRNQSRVVESFRARPPELLIEALRNGEAFKPDVFSQRVKGMGVGSALSDQELANAIWEGHVFGCLDTAEELLKLDIAKEQVNFVLQDLCPLVEIITATSWDNFRALRTELKPDGTPMARPEVYKTAKAILDALDASEPTELQDGMWHLPLVTDDELAEICEVNTDDFRTHWALISAGRCARVSYDKHRDPEPIADSIYRANRLIASGHMSPFEHPCRPMTQHDMFDDVLAEKILIPATFVRDLVKEAQADPAAFDATKVGSKISDIYCGNLAGWVQYRKFITNEQDYGLIKENA